jgi:hypothetical protein
MKNEREFVELGAKHYYEIVRLRKAAISLLKKSKRVRRKIVLIKALCFALVLVVIKISNNKLYSQFLLSAQARLNTLMGEYSRHVRERAEFLQKIQEVTKLARSQKRKDGVQTCRRFS